MQQTHNQLSPEQVINEKFDRALDNMRLERDGMTADESVRETEDASMPDKEYAFGEDNTGTEEYHDADDEDVEDMVGDE